VPLIAFIALVLLYSALSQESGCRRLLTDPFCVEWDVKP